MSGEQRYDISAMMMNVIHEMGHAYWDKNPPDIMPDYIGGKILRPNPGYLYWQQHPGHAGEEMYADMFIAWALGTWNTSALNVDRVNDAKTWMNKHAPGSQ